MVERFVVLTAVVAALLIATGCPSEEGTGDAPLSASSPTPTVPAEPEPLLLPVDSSIAPRGDLADQTAETRKRDPWDNFKTHDPLQVNFIQYAMGAAFEQYKTDFVGTLVKQPSANFQLIAAFYREGWLSRDDRDGQVKKMLAYAEKHRKEPVYKANLVVALSHIGFETKALELAERFKGEPWFKSNWDANFYTGSLLFRYGRYDDAVPYLEQALSLNPDPWTRLWLRLALHGRTDAETAKRRESLFPFGAHMGESNGAAFPFQDRADAWGFGGWGLAGAAAFADFDGDTYVDMIHQGVYASPEYYRFKPGHGYERVQDEAVEAISNVPASCIAVDFDNDGYTDLFGTSAAWFGAGPNRLLRNRDGKGFDEVKDTGDLPLVKQNSVGASALDYDRDGLVDLVVSGTKGGTVRLLQNKGGMVFEEVTEAAGLKPGWRPSVHLTTGDVNNDGWTDIFVNVIGDNQLYINKGDGTFSEEAEARGVAKGTPIGFSTWIFDYDNDGDMDIAAANFAISGKKFVGGFGEFPPDSFSAPREPGGFFQPTALYRNDGTAHFTNVSESAGIIPSSVMGAQFIDIELDGDLDIVLGPGSHPLENMQPLFIYRNDGGDHFTNITPVDNPRYYGKFHGMAFADVDRDGDADLFVNNGGVLLSDRWRDLFLENTTTGRHWIHIRPVGTKSNRSAIGARVTVYVGDRRLVQDVAAGQAFGSTNSPYLIFGLDQAKSVSRVTIAWPAGTTQELPSLAADQALIVTEGSDAYRRVY